MTTLKLTLIALTLFYSFQACLCIDDNFDKASAMSIIKLSQKDIQNFDTLKTQLILDLNKIKQLTPKGFSGNWISTNSYYLNQIDSTKYSAILSHLQGKYQDNFFISDSGQVRFILKDYVQMKCNDYNETYEHQLVSTNYNYPNLSCKNCPDTTLFVDSIINHNWKYVLEKYHSGH